MQVSRKGKGKLWSLLSLNVTAEPVEKQNEKEATRNKRTQKPGQNVNIMAFKRTKRMPGAKSIGKGTYGTCYPSTFCGIRVVIKEYYDTGSQLKFSQRDAKHEASILK